MTSKEATAYIETLVAQHVPYKLNPPFSLEEGFNCFGWVMFLRNIINNEQNQICYDSTNFRALGEFYKRSKEPPEYLDIPVFFLTVTEQRHIGLMLDNQMFTQCSESTNGVSIVDISRVPWKIILRAMYRHK